MSLLTPGVKKERQSTWDSWDFRSVDEFPKRPPNRPAATDDFRSLFGGRVRRTMLPMRVGTPPWRAANIVGRLCAKKFEAVMGSAAMPEDERSKEIRLRTIPGADEDLRPGTEAGIPARGSAQPPSMAEVETDADATCIMPTIGPKIPVAPMVRPLRPTVQLPPKAVGQHQMKRAVVEWSVRRDELVTDRERVQIVGLRLQAPVLLALQQHKDGKGLRQFLRPDDIAHKPIWPRDGAE